MSQVSGIKSKDLIKALKKLGFFILRQKGSHLRLAHQDGRKITVAIHNKEMAKGTLNAILRQAKISKKDLKRNL